MAARRNRIARHSAATHFRRRAQSGTKSKVAASGAWTDQNTFQMVLRYYETPHHDTVTCRFDEEKVQITFMNSMAQMSPTPKDKRPVLQGQLVG